MIEHDDLVALARRSSAAYSERAAVDAFVAGLGGSWPRGLSALHAYALCAQLPEHAFSPYDGPPNHALMHHFPPREEHVCAVCACLPQMEFDREWILPGAAIAARDHENTLVGPVIDVEELVTLDPVAPGADDVVALRAVLDAVDGPTSASDAEKALSAAKAVPRGPRGGGAPKMRRRVVLETLALAGVLPQASVPPKLLQWYGAAEEAAAWDALGRSFRSDLMLPLAGWTGGVDDARVSAVFGHLL